MTLKTFALISNHHAIGRELVRTLISTGQRLDGILLEQGQAELHDAEFFSFFPIPYLEEIVDGTQIPIHVLPPLDSEKFKQELNAFDADLVLWAGNGKLSSAVIDDLNAILLSVESNAGSDPLLSLSKETPLTVSCQRSNKDGSSGTLLRRDFDATHSMTLEEARLQYLQTRVQVLVEGAALLQEDSSNLGEPIISTAEHISSSSEEDVSAWIKEQFSGRAEPFTCAIIGCGNMGCGYETFKPGYHATHITAFQHNPQAKVVALVDMNEAAAKKYADTYGVPHAYSSIEEMMKEAQPEVVSIATPDETHFSVLETVLSFDCVKGIWCEKPFVTTLDQANKICRMIEEKSITVQVNHSRRSDRFWHHIKSQLPVLVGDVRSVVCRFTAGMTTNGAHMVDLMHMFFGKPHSVSAQDSASLCAQMHYDGFSVHLITVTDVNYPMIEVSFLGSKGLLDTINKPFGYKDYRYSSLQKDDVVHMDYLNSNHEREVQTDFARDLFDIAVDNLFYCMRTKQSCFSSPLQGKNAVEVLAAFVESSNNEGKIISLPFENGEVVIPPAAGDTKKWKK